MNTIVRKGIAFEQDLLEQFDKLLEKRGYKNRSEAIRDIIRKELIEENIRTPEKKMMASLTIVFDHHKHDIQHKLTHKQHQTDLIKSTLHIHLNKNDCMEVLILDGKVKDIKKFSDEMLATKGVKHGKLVFTGV
ncbi:MAG: nickel-responsive transcriptional regulator NikR [Nanobdellota archaeon]